jgi:hypothetical protein
MIDRALMIIRHLKREQITEVELVGGIHSDIDPIL